MERKSSILFVGLDVYKDSIDIALTNKNARILLALMTRGERFDPHHISTKPGSAALA
jgi:hypothetical protein